jgi:hypothetical protein
MKMWTFSSRRLDFEQTVDFATCLGGDRRPRVDYYTPRKSRRPSSGRSGESSIRKTDLRSPGSSKGTTSPSSPHAPDSRCRAMISCPTSPGLSTPTETVFAGPTSRSTTSSGTASGPTRAASFREYSGWKPSPFQQQMDVATLERVLRVSVPV